MDLTVSEQCNYDRTTCRKAVNALKDGTPPPAVILDYLSEGHQKNIEVIRQGLKKARSGSYDITLLEGGYGIGKSHLLKLAQSVAESENFSVKHLEVGQSNVFFNKPPEIFKKILGSEEAPFLSAYKRYGAFYSDKIGKFMAGIDILGRRHRLNGKAGLVILLDELENTFSSSNLPNYRSRFVAYDVLGALFKGYYRLENTDSDSSIDLKYVYVVMAITPGTLDLAHIDGPGYLQNPAEEWTLPRSRLNITPLSEEEAFKLALRIREVHSKALDWPAASYVNNDRLLQICREWASRRINRDERTLVRQIIDLLERTQQNY